MQYAPPLPIVRTNPRTLAVTVLFFLLLFFAFPWMSSLAEAPPEATVAQPLEPARQLEVDILLQINAVRAEHGLAPLRLNPKLSEAAAGHVADMQRNGNRSHRGWDGSSYGQRIARTGYLAQESNEAIGWGYNKDRMVNWWLNSRWHRPILLSPSLQEVGVAYSGDPHSQWGHWWVLNFGTPAEQVQSQPTNQ